MKAQKKSDRLSPEELARWRKKFRNLSNSARYAQSYLLAKKMLKLYPDEILFAHVEAVMTAEQTVGYSAQKIHARYRSAQKKFRKLLCRARAMTPAQLYSIRNEYYWFSKQPYKQYRLGVEIVARGNKHGYYSQGVGAAKLAEKYGLAGRKNICLRWAKVSEKAWRYYFRVVPNWYNSYLFLAESLGYQNRVREMDAAYAKAARIAGKPKDWKDIQVYRAGVEKVRKKIWAD